jgi:MoxR-like ATPase
MTSKDRIQKIRDLMLSDLVEREAPIRLALLASLAGEHLLLVGPPGTAKSLVSRRLQLAFADAPYFERLLTRFTVPEELFGPLSVKALENDRYERLTERYLPTASIAFLDEIFKANSAILNALLTLLNEREFDNGTQRLEVPIIAVIGASNELPREKELEALFDRFLLRLHVGPVGKEGFEQLLTLRGQHTPLIDQALKLTREDLKTFQAAAEKVNVPSQIVKLLGELREFCLANKLPVSDRRWRKVVKLLQTSACTNGRDTVSIWDCWLLQHCLWNTPDDRQKIYDWYAERVGAGETFDPKELLEVVTAWEGTLAKDKAENPLKLNEQGRPHFIGSDQKLVTKDDDTKTIGHDDEPLFTVSKGLLAIYTRYGFGDDLPSPDNYGKGYTEREIREFILFKNLPQAHQDGYFDNTANMMSTISINRAVGLTVHKAVYIKECLANLNQESGEIEAYKTQLQGHISELERQIKSHLWVTEDFLIPAQQSLNVTMDKVKNLEARLHNVIENYKNLTPKKKPTTKA